jgi:biopolymer transport protein TolR
VLHLLGNSFAEVSCMRAAALPTRIHSQPNVTPMIDVMLVLLIIFMVVTPMLDQGFRATPPTGVNLSKHLEEAGEAVIGIDDHGQLFLNRRPVSVEELKRALAARFLAAPANRVVYLRGDRNTEYQRVQETLALIGGAGARVVGLVTDAAPGQSVVTAP